MEELYAEGELLPLHTAFHQHNYSSILSYDASTLPTSLQPAFTLLHIRTLIATDAPTQALDLIKKDKTPELQDDLAGLKALALLAQGKTAEAEKEATKVAAEKGSNGTVQLAAGTVFAKLGKYEEALEVLSRHTGSLEAVAVIVQIHLSQNRSDLALKEATAAKKWSQDSLLANIAESWLGLRLGGDRYQQAYYEFEAMPLHQAIAEIHLGRHPEAEAALTKLRTEEPKNVEALANLIVLYGIIGKDTTALKEELSGLEKEHALLLDLQEKASLFDSAATKYAPKVAAA